MIEAKGAMKVYTGIGSRETPGLILALMGRISARMDRLGFTLRSGGADGADAAFEANSRRKEIFLPWNGFNGRYHDGKSHFDYLLCPGRELAQESVERFHPAPSRLYDKGRKLMARNAMQVLGRDCKSPTDVVICWTKNGKDVGGTSQAIRIARFHNIPVLNLGNPATETYFTAFTDDPDSPFVLP
jgi:hypothetical protein